MVSPNSEAIRAVKYIRKFRDQSRSSTTLVADSPDDCDMLKNPHHVVLRSFRGRSRRSTADLMDAKPRMYTAPPGTPWTSKNRARKINGDTSNSAIRMPTGRTVKF